ncbi:hypothetical protein EMA8858_01736 [Emticicia aquatica]|jgi:uncharacterized RDD family membrane protein YckC|uniref:RDD domain-containing protein n=1 Tax=Emticicia aquatica TaxID=1681835 RepID=A0ABM9AP70_9BACT|nr:RDD family protein [Emticicia aquatica]CAH0995613.1 hypothetical protein EMA8858_01736 [Emticicia aquatica]
MENVKIAGFFKRFFAFIIDFLLVFIVSLFLTTIILKPFGGVLGIIGLEDFQFGEDLVKGAFEILMAGFGAAGVLLLVIVVIFLTGFFYDLLMIASPKQGTLGKMLFSIKVIRIEGDSLSIFESFLRTTLKFITGCVFIFLWLICLFNSKRQTFHDMLAKSIVVNAN